MVNNPTDKTKTAITNRCRLLMVIPRNGNENTRFFLFFPLVVTGVFSPRLSPSIAYHIYYTGFIEVRSLQYQNSHTLFAHHHGFLIFQA